MGLSPCRRLAATLAAVDGDSLAVLCNWTWIVASAVVPDAIASSRHHHASHAVMFLYCIMFPGFGGKGLVKQ